MPQRLLAATATLVAFLVVAPAAQPASARAAWVWPVRGELITSYRNGDDPYAAGQHRGIDIAAEVGTPVVAATEGEVRFAGTVGSAGLTVSIRTADGLFDTSYLHLSSTVVREGDRVSPGERVGAVGTTGRRSARAPHLHFGIRDAGTRHGYHDPLAFLPPAAVPKEHPRPAPAPSPIPAPAAPEPAPAPRPAPVSAPEPAPAPRLGPAPAPGRVPTLAPRRAPAPRRVPALGPRRAPIPQSGRLPLPVPHLAAPAGRPGPDLGYALACIGLLLAAALLGLSEDGREATRRSRGRVAAALRPILGRRGCPARRDRSAATP
jgi:Peptidase family M23